MATDQPHRDEPTVPQPTTNGQPTVVPAKGLPPVAPPSGRFIAQLFLVPGMIVLVLVLILLAGNYLVSEKRTPKYFLDSLDSANEDIRWRGAADLAQVLQQKESLDLASDVVFALDLAERLQSALVELEQREQALAQEMKKMDDQEKLRATKKLKPQRDYVLYLISSLSGFTVPVSAPLLCKIATTDLASATDENTLRRRRAVWALANLGEKMKLFKKDLAPEKQQAILDTLAEEAKKSSLRGEWARSAHQYLTENKSLGVNEALAKCAESPDAFLRELVAMALNFWDGPLAIETLHRLANDDGHGTRIKIEDK